MAVPSKRMMSQAAMQDALPMKVPNLNRIIGEPEKTARRTLRHLQARANIMYKDIYIKTTNMGQFCARFFLPIVIRTGSCTNWSGSLTYHCKTFL